MDNKLNLIMNLSERGGDAFGIGGRETDKGGI